MTVNAETIAKAKELKAMLKATPRKVQAQVPAQGTFCQVAFCSDEASLFVEGRAICTTHNRNYKAMGS